MQRFSRKQIFPTFLQPFDSFMKDSSFPPFYSLHDVEISLKENGLRNVEAEGVRLKTSLDRTIVRFLSTNNLQLFKHRQAFIVRSYVLARANFIWNKSREQQFKVGERQLLSWLQDQINHLQMIFHSDDLWNNLSRRMRLELIES